MIIPTVLQVTTLQDNHRLAGDLAGDQVITILMMEMTPMAAIPLMTTIHLADAAFLTMVAEEGALEGQVAMDQMGMTEIAIGAVKMTRHLPGPTVIEPLLFM